MHERQIIEKTLSPNDLGLTGAHQAGMLIPKNEAILQFFPSLGTTEINPRVSLTFTDESGCSWKFNYIYYNNKLRGGTRNEYRLTGMTKFLKTSGLSPGDVVLFIRDCDEYRISYKRASGIVEEDDEVVRISLSDTWRIIEL